jgi:sugar diacid utilization regulator
VDDAALLEDVALTVGTPVLARGRDGRVVALLPSSPSLAHHLEVSFARFAPGLLHGTSLSVGLSGEATPGTLVDAVEEARFAHRVARMAGTPVSVVGARDVATHAVLLAAVPGDVRRAYAQRVLGPVLDHDDRTRSELVATLAEFLDRSCSWVRTAEALHLHVNTVRYRIERVEELTGRDLSRFADRVDVFLALRSL